MNNPYAPPKDLSNILLTPGFSTPGETELSLEGNLIVCADNATWPDRCVICNQETHGPKFTRKMYWHPSWVYLMILFNWLIYLIVSLIVRKSGTVHISLCETHKSRRLTGLLLIWIGFPASFAAIFVGAFLVGTHDALGLISILGLLGMIGFPIAGIILSRTVVPNRIQNGMLWLKAGKRFTDSL